MARNDRKIKTVSFLFVLCFSIKSFCLWASGHYTLSKMWICILLSDLANFRVIILWSIAGAERQTKLNFRSRSTGHNLQTSLHLLRLKGFMETIRATPHSPLPRLLPCTHYNAMKTILRHGSGLQPHSRPPGISQSAVMMSDLQLFVSLFPAHSMPSSPFSLQVCEPMPEWARVSVATSVFKQPRPGIDLP